MRGSRLEGHDIRGSGGHLKHVVDIATPDHHLTVGQRRSAEELAGRHGHHVGDTLRHGGLAVEVLTADAEDGLVGPQSKNMGGTGCHRDHIVLGRKTTRKVSVLLVTDDSQLVGCRCGGSH